MGGENELDNLQATCKTCNTRKKGFVGTEEQIKEYLSKRRHIDVRIEMVNASLLPVLNEVVSSGDMDKEDAELYLENIADTIWNRWYAWNPEGTEAMLKALECGDIAEIRRLVSIEVEAASPVRDHRRWVERIDEIYDASDDEHNVDDD